MREGDDVPDESVSATTVVDATAEVVFAVLADPTQHAAVDGTGRVLGSGEGQQLTAVGQEFTMDMQHELHPDGEYQTVNRVQVFDPPRAIAWSTGYRADDGSLRFGGWVWRYDLSPVGPASTSVVLTYDWSAVPGSVREYLTFPPFAPGHLDESLANLAALVRSLPGDGQRSG